MKDLINDYLNQYEEDNVEILSTIENNDGTVIVKCNFKGKEEIYCISLFMLLKFVYSKT